MIRVCRILGEGFDLETGQAYDKALVITNDITEIVVPASEEIIEKILLLYAESRGAPSNGEVSMEPEYSEIDQPLFQEPEVDEDEGSGEVYYEQGTGVISV